MWTKDVKGPVQMATVQTTSPLLSSQSGVKVRFEAAVGKAPLLWWLTFSEAHFLYHKMESTGWSVVQC